MEYSDVQFFDENEKRVNRQVSIMFIFVIAFGPVLAILRKADVFMALSYKSIIIYEVMVVTLFFIQRILLHVPVMSHFTKYFTMLGIEAIIFYLTCQNGLVMFISYMIVPVLSCMYYNKKFTLRMSVICLAITIVSLVVRAHMGITNEHMRNYVSMERLPAFIAGTSIEYIVISFICYNIVKTAQNTLMQQYERTVQVTGMKQKLINGFANLVESKDDTTGQHVKRTSEYVRMLCDELLKLGYYTDELDRKNIELMVSAAPLHDMGKLFVPEEILSKPGRLTEEEFKQIKIHPEEGSKLIIENLKDIEDREFVEKASKMALCHHEWWNGQGYPRHLQGEQIPLEARIMSAADVLDALLSVRPYKEAISLNESLDIIQRGAGSQFDPKIVEAVVGCREQLEKKFKDQSK